MGQGTFNKVSKSLETFTKQLVAVKNIRTIGRCRATKTELRMLSAMLNNDPTGKFQSILLKDYFDYKRPQLFGN